MINLRAGTIAGLASIGFALASFCPSAVQAQSATASDGVKGEPGRAAFQGQSTPVELTPEQLRMREEAFSRTNPPGPPLPVSPEAVQRSPALPPTEGASAPPSQNPPGPNRAPNSQSGGSAAPPAPNDFVFFRYHDQGQGSNSKNDINEPSMGAAGKIQFVTSNTDAAFSTDGGSTFTFVDPFTLFPASDGGLCCDQTLIYDRTTGIFIWQLQYFGTATGENRYRIAIAPAKSIATSGWCYWDFTPQDFGQPAGANFDYPDIALTDTFVYFQARVFPKTGNALGTAVWRIPLAPISTCSGFTYNYNVFTDAFTFSLAQGARSTMYWFRHIDTSNERLFNWPDSSGTISWNDVGVTTWFNSGYSCPAPNGNNWCGRNNMPTIGRTSWVANGVIGTMWNSAQGGGRAFPYIKVARFNESTKALINEPDIFNASYAWVFPAVGVNDRGHIAGTAYWGGGGNYPTMVNLIWDDISATPPPWENYGVITSGTVINNNRWGDYYASRRHGTYGNTWVATGAYQYRNAALTNFTDTISVWIGRARDGASNGLERNSHDFDGSLRSDIAWRSSAGDTAVWLMSGASVVGSAGFGAINNVWSIVGQRDFNGDGKYDWLWRDTSGNMYIWFLNGIGAGTSVSLGNVSTNWVIVGTGDFNGDGKGDILWRDGNGNVAVWLMNGSTVINSTGFGAVPAAWVIVGAADFNGDGKADVLWRNFQTGDVAIWFMNGNQVSQSVGVANVPLVWTIIQTGDFDGNGSWDILWRDNSGNVAVWLMSGSQVLSSLGYGNVSFFWGIPNTGDFNGDGRSDILWRSNAGDVAMWFINGGQVLQSVGVGNVPTSWTIQGLNAD